LSLISIFWPRMKPEYCPWPGPRLVTLSSAATWPWLLPRPKYWPRPETAVEAKCLASRPSQGQNFSFESKRNRKPYYA